MIALWESASRWIRLATVDSTNSYLLAGDFEPGAVVLAERQTAGRGRQGRHWLDQGEGSILLSALFVLDQKAPFALIPLAAGAALLHTVRELPAPLPAGQFSLKWPNDLLCLRNGQWHKVAGVLVESQGANAQWRVVIGIGLNFSGATPDLSGESAAFPPAALYPGSAPIRRDEFVARLMVALNQRLAQLIDPRPEFLEELRAASYLRGRIAQLSSGAAVVRDIDSDGALLLEDLRDGRLHRIYELSEGIQFSAE